MTYLHLFGPLSYRDQDLLFVGRRGSHSLCRRWFHTCTMCRQPQRSQWACGSEQHLMTSADIRTDIHITVMPLRWLIRGFSNL